jgi:hypothetical protein
MNPSTCGAKNRAGKTCGHPAGYGTEHRGEGRCRFHGGLTPIKSGRYSKVSRKRVRELIEQYAQDPEPLNILPELAAARALFQDFIERYDEWREALLLWWAAQTARRSKLEEVRFAAELVLEQSDSGASQDHRRAAAELVLFHAAPRQVLDISHAQGLLAEVTKIVKRIEEIRNANAISRPDLLRLMHEMARVVERWVTAPDLTPEQRLERIRDGWLGLRV